MATGKYSEKQIGAELAEINSRIPAEWQKNVAKQVPASPEIKKVMELALVDDRITPEKKAQIKNLLDAGYFDKTKWVEVPKYAKLINDFVTRQINIKIKKGLLPPKGYKLTHFDEIYKRVMETNKKDEI